MTRADLDKDPQAVAAMFDDVARRYDLTNDVLSLGRTAAWRRAVTAALEPLAGTTGTGTSSTPLIDQDAVVVSCDFSLGMLRQGQVQYPTQLFVAGDALALPFADDTFDAVTISFGLRNITDSQAGLREMARVTRPGGRLVVCEFSTPTWAPLATTYKEYLMKALPEVADRISSNPDAYIYLAESIRAWPDQDQLARVIAANGWTDVRYRNLTGGIVALHRATAV